MIEAEGPDGVVHEFPEGTEEKVIRSVLAKHYGWDGATPNSVGPKEIPIGDKSSEYTLSGLITGKNKYQEAASKKADKLDKMGLMDAGVGQRLFQGMTLGTGDEAQAILDTPIAMIEQGTFNPIEGYKYSKEFQNERLNRSKKNTGFAGDVAEFAGGIATGANAARNGLTFLKQGQNLGGRMLSAAKEGATYGAITGATTNEGEDRISGAAKGAAIGAGIGAGIPALGAGLAFTPAAPIASNIMSMVNPERAAQARLARALVESGRSADDVLMDLSNAAASGQGEYALADALNNPGQRLLSTVARSPGKGRTNVIEFLENRQAGQSRRISNAIAEGLNAPKTAANTEADMLRQRATDAATNYGAARGSAGYVNVTPALDAAHAQLPPAFDPLTSESSKIPEDTITGIVSRVRKMIGNGNEQIVDFDTVLQTKKDIDAIIEGASPSQQRALVPIRNALDEQLAAASGPYANARNTYRQQTKAIEAIPSGRSAAMRGRMDDTIPKFQAMSPEEQAAFRVGYADPLIEQVQNAPIGVNKVRPLLAEGPQAELQAFADFNQAQKLANRLERENQMFETRRQAVGGSQTADNLADQAENQIDPRVFTNLLSGNFTEAARNAARGAGNVWGGNTPRVREYLAQMLLQRGDAPNIRTLVQDIENRGLASDERARALSRALLTGSTEYANQRRPN